MNRSLHLFGWVICHDLKTGRAFPARTQFMGFEGSSDDQGFLKLRKWLGVNAGVLKDHAEKELG